MKSQRILQAQLKTAKADTRLKFFYKAYKAAPKEKLFLFLIAIGTNASKKETPTHMPDKKAPKK